MRWCSRAGVAEQSNLGSSHLEEGGEGESHLEEDDGPREALRMVQWRPLLIHSLGGWPGAHQQVQVAALKLVAEGVWKRVRVCMCVCIWQGVGGRGCTGARIPSATDAGAHLHACLTHVSAASMPRSATPYRDAPALNTCLRTGKEGAGDQVLYAHHQAAPTHSWQACHRTQTQQQEPERCTSTSSPLTRPIMHSLC